MPQRVRALAIAVLASAFLVGPLATSASGDARYCGWKGRPACTILRPPELGVRIDPLGRTGPECVVLVGGFGSTNGDQTFDDLLRWTEGDALYQPIRSGYDFTDTFTYDTTGPIDRTAADLTRLVRTLGHECGAIHIVTHSMGGAVADRAFSMGLSAADGVATYIALSGPHNGATLARALRPAIEADPLIAIETSVLARSIGQPDPTTPAAHDLASIEHAPREVRGVAQARVRYATDGMVLRRDTYDRRVDVREYMPASLALSQLEGHGGVLHNEDVRRFVSATIATHAVAEDGRTPLERLTADAVSRKVDERVAAFYDGVSRHLADPLAPYTLAAATIGVTITRAIADAVADAANGAVATGRP